MHNKRCGGHQTEVRDFGPEPFVLNIDHAAKINQNFRTAIWTGKHLQLTLMCIPVGCDVGVEMHECVDQFIRIESGRAAIVTGGGRNSLGNRKCIDACYSAIIPAGTWHNIINAGNTPLKLYSIYAPTQHSHGTVHKTKSDAEH